jgi:hypothetical protein
LFIFLVTLNYFITVLNSEKVKYIPVEQNITPVATPTLLVAE